METIRICIGTEEKTKIPCKVLMHSVLQHTKNKVEFTLMEGKSWSKLSQRKLGVGTGFSLMRWKIPQFFDYEGFAIYFDADQLVLKDVLDLWNQNIGKDVSSIYCTYQEDKWFPNAPNTSVMLIDCEKAKADWWPIDRIETYLAEDCPARKRYAQVMHAKHISPPPTKITNNWNQLNKCPETTCLLHYTTENTQPWYYPQHPLKDKWRDAFRLALKDQFISKEEVLEATSKYRPHNRSERGTGMHPYWRKFI